MDTSVSVVVPCYKYAHYLEECVDSVARQTFPPKEIIIVDDGSPDETTPTAHYLMTKYPSLVRLVEKKNGGLASARNAGIKVATGTHIMCLDADDKLVPGALEEHVKLLTDSKTIAQCALMEFGERHVINIPTNPTSLERIMQSNTVYCNALFPRQAWVDVGGFDESDIMRLGYEDWECWIRMLDAGYHVNTSEFIALRYRCHEGQMTQATAHPNRQTLYEYIYNKHRDLYERFNLTIAGYIKHD